MANTKSAEKAIRQSARRHNRNRIVRSRARTEIKQAAAEIGSGNLDTAESTVRQAIRALDKAAAKGILKKNNAARRKSRLLKKLNQARAAGK